MVCSHQNWDPHREQGIADEVGDPRNDVRTLQNLTVSDSSFSALCLLRARHISDTTRLVTLMSLSSFSES